MSAILPSSVLNPLEGPTKTAVSNLPAGDMNMILNGPLLGPMPGATVLGMPGASLKPQIKAAILALLLDKSMLGAGIDARIADAVKALPSSGGLTADAVDKKIADAVKALPSSSGLTADAVDKKIADAVKGLPTTANIGKMHLVSGGGRRRGTKRGSKRRGTKRR